MNNKILIIIVTYNGKSWIHKCIESVLTSKIPLSDIYIIDNGSTDGTQKYIIETFPNIIVYQSKENLGFGKANNIGLRHAIEHNYDYVYLLNQDAWIMPDTIETLIKIQNMYPEYGILSPVHLEANMLNLDNNFGKIFSDYNSNRDIISDLFFYRRKDVYEVPFVMAAHWLISKECFQEVGGFSPTFPHYGEDNNYIHRAISHGYKIGIVPNSIAIHDRENRKNNKRKIIYMSYIGTLIKLSNINDLPQYPFVYCVKQTLKSILRNKSFLPIKYFISLIKQSQSIKHNNEISKGTQAFI